MVCDLDLDLYNFWRPSPKDQCGLVWTKHARWFQRRISLKFYNNMFFYRKFDLDQWPWPWKYDLDWYIFWMPSPKDHCDLIWTKSALYLIFNNFWQYNVFILYTWLDCNELEREFIITCVTLEAASSSVDLVSFGLQCLGTVWTWGIFFTLGHPSENNVSAS